MIVVKETPGGPELEAARAKVGALPLLDAFLAQADLDPSLEEDTRVFLGSESGSTDQGDLRSAVTVYLGLGKPALAVATLPSWSDEVARETLRQVRAALEKSGPESPWLAIDDASHEAAWKDAFLVRDRWEELHYLLPKDVALPIGESWRVEHVRPSQLDRLDEFLGRHGAQAWSRTSYAEGFYVWVCEGNDVVAAAGVHFVTPEVGQIANVLVREDRRGRDLGKMVTAAVARRLRSAGRLASLFVRADNAAAIGVYEKLGFKRVRKLVGMELV
jgi:ribosomal protein S18 acetylase RimI-like enzyme